MSWQMAVVGAIGAAQIQQQGAIGKYNQRIANRNAQVKEQEAQILDVIVFAFRMVLKLEDVFRGSGQEEISVSIRKGYFEVE